MSEGNYVIRVLARILTARLLYRVLVAVSIIFISNFLIGDPALADSFDLASSIVSIVMIASEVGMSMVLLRTGAKQTAEEVERHYGTALVIETIAWLALYVIVVGGYWLLNGATPLFWLLAILGVNQAIIQYRVPIRSIYRSQHSHERITYIEVLDGLSKLVGIYFITQWFTNLEQGAYVIAGWYTATTLLFIGIYWLYSFKLVWPKFDATLVKPLLSEGVWFGAQSLIMTVYFEIDKWVLRLLQISGLANIPVGDIARYGAASRVIIFFLIFHRLGLQVITPYLYAAYPDQLDRYRRIVQWSTRAMTAAGVLLGVLVITQAEAIMHLLYRPEFWNAIPALMIFGAFLMIRFAGITSSQIFATTGQQPKRTKQEGLAVIVNIILDCILMPFFSFLGGAIASFITEALFQGVFFAITRRLIQAPIWKTLASLLPTVVAGGITGGVVWYSQTWWDINAVNKSTLAIITLATAVAGSVIYIVLLYILQFFKDEDWKLLKKDSTQPTPVTELAD